MDSRNAPRDQMLTVTLTKIISKVGLCPPKCLLLGSQQQHTGLQYTISVTIFGTISPLWQNVKSLR